MLLKINAKCCRPVRVITESLNAMDTGSSEDEADDIEHLPSRSDVLIAFATQEGTLEFDSHLS